MPKERRQSIGSSRVAPRAREELFELLVSSIRDYAVFMLDTEGRVVTWNQGAESIKGYRADEIVGEHYRRFFTDEDVAAGKPDRLLETARREGRIEEQGWRVRKDGTRFVADVTLAAIVNDKGRSVGFAKVTRDVTERIRAQETQRELAALKQAQGSLERIRAFAANIPGLAYRRVLEPDGKVSYPFIGGGYVELLGFDRESAREGHADLTRVTHADDLETFRAQLERSARDLTFVEIELRMLLPSGEVRWMHSRSQPRRQDDGSIVWDAIAVDVTERRRLEQRERETQRQLAHAQRMEAIGNLTGGMAHDFNNLLQIIIINSGMLRERVAADRSSSEMADAITGASRRGADLIRRLLAFSRRQLLEPSSFDMGELAKAMIRLLRDTLGEDIEVELNVAPNTWPAFADPAQVETALANLAVNSRDAMPQGGKLRVCVKNAVLDAAYAASRSEVTAGEYVLLEVSDTGKGMPAEVQAHAFEPFYTTKDVGKGTGLGLSMIYGFAKQSGGHVSLYSEEGKGTTVRLYLPRAADGGSTQADVKAIGSVSKGGNELILVVDDNHDVRKTVRRALEQLGYRVLEADGPRQALELLSETKIDLLFTDIVMPGGMYGPELARQSLERDPKLKVLYTSGFPEVMRENIGSLPANSRLLAKPYTRAELAARVREVLDTSE
jgi:PAS domain S-box-containing protein